MKRSHINQNLTIFIGVWEESDELVSDSAFLRFLEIVAEAVMTPVPVVGVAVDSRGLTRARQTFQLGSLPVEVPGHRHVIAFRQGIKSMSRH